MALTASLQEAVLEATLERITYANEDSGYVVAKVDWVSPLSVETSPLRRR